MLTFFDLPPPPYLANLPSIARHIATGLAACLLPSLAIAQSAENNERWFQIEMVIFSQGNAAVSGEEQWRTDVERALSYPTNWVQLKPASEMPLTEDDTMPPSTEVVVDGPQDSAFATTAQDPALEDDAERTLYLLPEDELELNADARQLGRSNQYRVLFHGAWRQPLVERQDAPAILINGGDEWGDHYELEGTVTVSVSKYLHVDTNLWLTQFASNFGQEKPDWPDLPRRPNAPLDPEAPLVLNDFGAGAWTNSGTNTAGFGQYSNVLSRPYVIEHIAVMRESRKMYSKELHYLDHPLLGMLVKILPWTPPETSVESSAELNTFQAP